MTVESEATDAPRSDVTVTRTVSHPLSSVWSALLTDEGAEALLGPGGRLGDKGHTWQAADGTHGATRSFHPMEQVRFSWHADQGAPPTMVDLRLTSVDDDRTTLEVVHSQLGAEDRDFLVEHWTAALQRIDHDAL